jgi:AraC-like DNA-binding protein
MNNHFLNLHEVILIITSVETLFLAAFFGAFPGRQAQSRRLLAVFFVLVAGMLASTLVIWNSYLQTLPIAQTGWMPAMLSACLLLQGPVLYMYLRSLSQPLDLWRWRNALHLLPALVAVGVIFAMDVSQRDWLPWLWPELSPLKRGAVKFVWALFKCSPLLYVLACFRTEYQLRQRMREFYSSMSARELRAAEIVLGGFFIHWLWSFVAYFLGGYISGDMNDLLGILNNYFTVILVNTLFVFGLLNTRQLLVSQANQPCPATEPANSSPSPEKRTAIERGMTEQKLYLDSQLTVDSFAAQIGLRPREVSSIINSHYNSNFFEFVNRYRVEEAKRLLLEQKDETILAIAFKAGFNSQSAFHRFFKRVTGVTPSGFRRPSAGD